jgi:Zn-dependent M16 (insulinase) family peptidase
MFLLSLSFVLALLTMMNAAFRPKLFQLQRMKSRMWSFSSLLSSTAVVGSTAASSAAASLHAFELINKFDVKEYGLNGTRYRHRKSGAEVVSIETSDDNKVFGITFRTPPADSTGIAHIMEHSVLCGSRKYPTKEPFAHLLKSSMQNFLNAFTYPDRTCYPVASTNTKDFYNLVNVYLDAVLHPRAATDEQVFRQEGWHYEMESVSSPLKIKGVVYNEMKGVYGDPSALLGRTVQQSLFPQNAYGTSSSIVKLVFYFMSISVQ